MSEKSKEVTYDFMSISIKRENQIFLTDSMKAFGWQVLGERIKTIPEYFQNRKIKEYGSNLVYIEFSRNKLICNKPKLLSLQTDYEEKLSKIHKYLRWGKYPAESAAIASGLIGMGLFALSSSFFLKEIYWAYAICTTVGIVACGGAIFIYKIIRRKSEKLYLPMIRKLIEESHTIISEAKELVDSEELTTK